MTDLYDDCPVKPPTLLRADSIVETCGCGKWIQRYPAFMGDDDSFWQCEKCGRTWINRRPGRPYGPKSKEWAWVQEQFNKLYLDISPFDRDTVLCDPPLESLDWQAVEEWFQSHNIYRVFIGVSVEVVEE
jgi:hypothetical protein